MSIDVEVDIGNADPALKVPPTVNELVQMLRPLLSGLISETLVPYVISQDTPGTDDQDKAWIRLGPSQEPLGTFTYLGGVWVPETPSVGNEFGFFFGDPATYFNSDGRGLRGLGPIAGSYYGWQIMNGNHGTLDMSDKFLAMAHMNNSGGAGYVAGWQAKFDGVQANSGTGIKLKHFDATAATANVLGKLYGENAVTAEPTTVVPPFQAVAIIQFIGYSYVDTDP